MITTRFNRGLSPAFLAELLDGTSAAVMKAVRSIGLDVRLRDDYLNAYTAGRSIARIHWLRGAAHFVVHEKYLHADAFPQLPRALSHHYYRLPITPAFVNDVEHELRTIVRAAEVHAGTEERTESQLVRDNGSNGAIGCIDRQVKIPEVSGHLDVVGATNHGALSLALIEIKCDLNNRILQVPQQVARYLDAFTDGPDAGLRDDIAASFALVARQLLELGFVAPDPSRFQAGMAVLGLVVLVRYSPRSELLERAHEAARDLPRAIKLWVPEHDSQLQIPPLETWTNMG